MEITPIHTKNRYESIDIIRGIALFGIFLVNTPGFFTPLFTRDYYSLPTSYTGVNQWIRLFFDLFIQGKFYPMFSFLFGLGFYLFFQRAKQNKINANWLFSRRLLVLLLFGLSHLIFLWFGDILHTYALVGFFLLFFYKRSLKTILIWAFSLMTLFMGILSVMLLIPVSYLEQMNADNLLTGKIAYNAALESYTSGNFGQLLTHRFTSEVIPILSNFLFEIPLILSLFLLGLYAGKEGIYFQPDHHKSFIIKVKRYTGVVSVPLLILIVMFHIDYLNFGSHQWIVNQLLITLSGLFLCFYYVSSLTLLLNNESLRKKLKPFGYAGRMALTNYLSQTVISLSFFIGLGLYGKVSLAFGLLYTIIVYILQLITSTYWLKRYRFGPVEWLWRSLTYGHIQPMKVSNNKK